MALLHGTKPNTLTYNCKLLIPCVNPQTAEHAILPNCDV